jgi:hypothetical protein
MPVAVFVSSAIVIVSLLGNFISTAAASSDMQLYRPFPSSTVIELVLRTEFKFLNALINPVPHFEPMSMLPLGERVPWLAVGRSLLFRVVPCVGMLSLFGAWRLRRRELGLPPS